MKIAVIGAGSLGLAYGHFLRTANECVLLTRREEQADAINERGIEVTHAGARATSRVNATADARRLSDAELVLVVTKAYDVASAADLIRTHSPHSLVLPIQNGLGSIETLNTTCGRDRVLAGISYLGAKRTSDTEVTLSDTLRTVFSEQDGTKTERVRRVFEAMQASGLEPEISDSVNDLIWQKLTLVVAQNALSALTNSTFGEMRESDNVWQVVELILDEFRRVAIAEGVRLDDDLISKVRHNWVVLADHHSSMWQDLNTGGGRTEIDAINGAIVALGDKHGIATPANRLIYNLVRAFEDGALNRR